MSKPPFLTWVEIDTAALEHNIRAFHSLIGPSIRMLAVVKSNAYGHGMIDVARLAVRNGADFLGIHALEEGIALRDAGIEAPILLMGFILIESYPEAIQRGLSLAAPCPDLLKLMGECARAQKTRVSVHLKLETGLNRLGMGREELEESLAILRDYPEIDLQGVYTHYANIEDTIEHGFAMHQRECFERLCLTLAEAGYNSCLRHTACTAAVLLFPHTYYDMVRVGIGLYGMWPSKETLITALGQEKPLVDLRPVLTWKTRVAQVKHVTPGDTVGYGRTHKITRPSAIAVLPVGYADGYDRRLSNQGSVLIRQENAPVVGRVCMNMIMVDVSHIPECVTGDEAVLLGRQGAASITAESMAGLAGTINYEITTRINPMLPRIFI